MVDRRKELESENTRLKKMYAEERLKAETIKEAIEKVVTLRGISAKGGSSLPANLQFIFLTAKDW